MSYRLVRSLLFRLDPETAHDISLGLLSATAPLRLPRLLSGPRPKMERQLLGLRFPNPVGLAAGLDKNGDHLRALSDLGFGFLEVGTVTPRPQNGNPRPRMFRLPRDGALINRMGFNNKGVDHLVQRVQSARFRGILGINIGKNADTPADRAIDDYVHCLQKVYPYASYIAVNVSSPNTKGLRDLQHGSRFDDLLATLKCEQLQLSLTWNRYVPIVVKISPDMDDEQLRGLADALLRHRMDAVAATNTTVDRDAVIGHRHGNEAGGLSGRPLLARSTATISLLSEHLHGALPIIGIGGINRGSDAVMKLRAGASLVQLYTGFVYRGPRLIRECVTAMRHMDEPVRSVPEELADEVVAE
ncbi:quinone-dependent dihydroorotate dehydrogenase [Methylonatrum kenyense]|uniref:quinone-dependent dihydroorotate dehydrogenase n=1 Tax=Methylonatrum kenyense TaxID=455253 RepID=UPI0020C14474|nr:quinone-dependent dihydroorotate dehydrogenase [Methylonatrum kenyense]MCK8516423.1 quinone-dependent dihydroorotate dehydrogenase [Methylonatrum kenyense]